MPARNRCDCKLPSVEPGQAQTLTFGEEQQPSETLNALLGLKD
jgi:hypothetical protein